MSPSISNIGSGKGATFVKDEAAVVKDTVIGIKDSLVHRNELLILPESSVLGGFVKRFGRNVRKLVGM